MAVQSDSHSRARGRRIPIRARSGLSRLISRLGRLASIQIRLVTAEFKLSVQRVLVVGALAAVGIALVILAIIFVHIGVFQILERHMSSRWVWLIYAGTDTLAAVALILSARSLLHRPLLDSEEEPEDLRAKRKQP